MCQRHYQFENYMKLNLCNLRCSIGRIISISQAQNSPFLLIYILNKFVVFVKNFMIRAFKDVPEIDRKQNYELIVEGSRRNK